MTESQLNVLWRIHTQSLPCSWFGWVVRCFERELQFVQISHNILSVWLVVGWNMLNRPITPCHMSRSFHVDGSYSFSSGDFPCSCTGRTATGRSREFQAQRSKDGGNGRISKIFPNSNLNISTHTSQLNGERWETDAGLIICGKHDRQKNGGALATYSTPCACNWKHGRAQFDCTTVHFLQDFGWRLAQFRRKNAYIPARSAQVQVRRIAHEAIDVVTIFTRHLRPTWEEVAADRLCPWVSGPTSFPHQRSDSEQRSNVVDRPSAMDEVNWFSMVVSFAQHLCVGLLFLMLYPAAAASLLRLLRHPSSHSHNSLSHTIFHTQLCHTPSFTHNSDTQSCTHNFVTHHLSQLLVTRHLSHTHTQHNFVTNTVSHTIFHTQLCAADVALGDLDLHFAWQALRLRHWVGSGGALGRAGSPGAPRHFAWQAWHLVTSTIVSLSHTIFHTQLCHTHHLSQTAFRGTLRGRRGTWRRWLAFCVAGVALGGIHLRFAWQGVALGDIHLGFAWQAWHVGHWAGSGGALERAGSLWAPSHFAWQAWHLVTSTFVFRGRRGTWWHPPSFCVAGVALGDIHLHFAWQTWHLVTSTCVLRGRCGTYLSDTTLSHTHTTLLCGHRWKLCGNDAGVSVAGMFWRLIVFLCCQALAQDGGAHGQRSSQALKFSLLPEFFDALWPFRSCKRICMSSIFPQAQTDSFPNLISIFAH